MVVRERTTRSHCFEESAQLYRQHCYNASGYLVQRQVASDDWILKSLQELTSNLILDGIGMMFHTCLMRIMDNQL
jgi:hypothetical protein